MDSEELYNEFSVTPEQLNKWADEYESGDWSNMEFGKISKGCPRIADDPLESNMIKSPRSRLIATEKLQDE